jgi:hypothetical protein
VLQESVSPQGADRQPYLANLSIFNDTPASFLTSYSVRAWIPLVCWGSHKRASPAIAILSYKIEEYYVGVSLICTIGNTKIQHCKVDRS